VKTKLENSIQLGQGSRLNRGKRATGHSRKGFSDERGHKGILKASTEKCSDK